MNKKELLPCSRFITAEQIPVLAKMLCITVDEKANILSNFSDADEQAYQMLITWHSKAHNNKSRQSLLQDLEVSGLCEAAKQ